MDILKINEFYGRLIKEKDSYEGLIEKIRNISTDEELKKIIREEVLSVAKSLGYSFTEQDLFDYEKIMAQELSDENLENVAGGANLRTRLIAGSFLSLNFLSAGLSSASQTSAMLSKDAISSSPELIFDIGSNSTEENFEKQTLTTEKEVTESSQKGTETIAEQSKENDQIAPKSENQTSKKEKKDDLSASKKMPRSFKEQRDQITSSIGHIGGTDKEKDTKNETKVVDNIYLLKALNLIDPYVNKLTGVTKRFRFAGPAEQITLDKQNGATNYSRKYNEDQGQGFADLMRILFPSNTGVLNTAERNLEMPAFTQDCQPTPEMVARVAAFIHNYRSQNKKEKTTILEEFEGITEEFNKIFEAAKKNTHPDREIENKFKGFTNYKLYEQIYKDAIKNFNPENKDEFDNQKASATESAKKLCGLLQVINGTKSVDFDKIDDKKFNKFNFNGYKKVKEFFEKNEHNLLDKTSKFFTERLFGETFWNKEKCIDNVKKANTMLHLLKSAIYAIDNQEYEGEVAEGSKIAPTYTVEKMLMGYFIEQFDTEAEIKSFYNETRKLIHHEVKNAQQEKKELEVAQEKLNQTKQLLGKLKVSESTPYQSGTLWNGDTATVGEVKKAGDKDTIQFGGHFADCADIAVRHVVNLLGYSVDKNWNAFLKDVTPERKAYLETKLGKIKDAVLKDGSFEFLPLKNRLQMFFLHQSKVGVDAGDRVTRTLWEYAICNMNKENDADLFKIIYVNGNYELETGYINTLKLIYNIAKSLELAEPEALATAKESIVELQKKVEEDKQLFAKKENEDTEDESDKKNPLLDAMEKTYKLFNPNVKINFENDDMKIKVPGSCNKKDIFGDSSVVIGEEEKIYFDFYQSGGHAEIKHKPIQPLQFKDDNTEDQAFKEKLQQDDNKSTSDKLLIRKYNKNVWGDERDDLGNVKLDDFNKVFGAQENSSNNSMEQLRINNEALEFLENLEGEENNPERIREELREHPDIGKTDIKVKLKDTNETVPLSYYIWENFVKRTNDDKIVWNFFGNGKIETFKNLVEIDSHFKKVGNSFYRIEGKTATFCACEDESLESIKIPEKITFDGKTCTVTKLDSYCFYDSYSLKSIEIPATVKTIDNRAFRDCKNLQTVTFAENSQLETIGEYAFYCTAIDKIAIPASVKNIQEEAFYGCSNLHTVTFVDNSQLETIEGKAFHECKVLGNIEIPASVKNIQEEAFYGCSNLHTVTFADNSQLETIGRGAFIECYDLSNIKIPASVKNIGHEAFKHCSDLKTVTFADNSQLDTIGEYAFYRAAIDKIAIPASVKTIGRMAFYECPKLTQATFKNIDNLQNYGQWAFNYAVCQVPAKLQAGLRERLKDVKNIYKNNVEAFMEACLMPGGKLDLSKTKVRKIDKEAFYYTEYLKEVILPETLETIENRAFYNCSKLTTATFKNIKNLKSVGKFAFNYSVCQVPEELREVLRNQLKNVKVIDKSNREAFVEAYLLPGNKLDLRGSNVEKIAAETFYNGWDSNIHLSHIVFPKSLKTIGEKAFEGNYLQTIEFEEGCQLETIKKSAFENNSSLTNIHLPKNLKIIGDRAFYYCSSLSKVEIEDEANSQLSYIGKQTFSYDKEIKLPQKIFSVINDNLKNEKTINKKNADDFLLVYSSYVNNESVLDLSGTRIKTIEENSFSQGNFNKIILPSTLKTIKNEAFSYCRELTTVEFAPGSQLETIEKRAFIDCSKLKGIKIPASVRNIQEEAFEWCEQLSKVDFENENNVDHFSNRAFANTPYADTFRALWDEKIKTCTFINNNNIDYWLDTYMKDGILDLSNTNIERIDEDIFSNSYGKKYDLKELKLPADLKNIGKSAFESCSNLHTVTFAENSQLETIEERAFSWCKKLSNINIPASIKTIGGWAFSWCEKLSNINIPATVKIVGNTAFIKTPIENTYKDMIIKGVQTITSENKQNFINACWNNGTLDFSNTDITEIGDHVFERYNLRRVILPANFRKIGAYAFADCVELKSVETMGNASEVLQGENWCFGSGIDPVYIAKQEAFNRIKDAQIITQQNRDDFLTVYWNNGTLDLSNTDITEIGDHVFERYNLRRVILPASFNKMGAYAFANCIDLQSVTTLGDTINISIGENWSAGSGIDPVYIKQFAFNRIKYAQIITQQNRNDFLTVYCNNGTLDLSQTIITEIGPSAFRYVNNITKVILPASLEKIGIQAFGGCSGLLKIEFKDISKLKEVGQSVFAETNYKLPQEIKSLISNRISNDIFITDQNRQDFIDIYMDENGVLDLSSTGIIGIYKWAFNHVSSITKIILPASLEKIDDNAFWNCARLSSIEFSKDSNPTLSTHALAGCQKVNITGIPADKIPEIPSYPKIVPPTI